MATPTQDMIDTYMSITGASHSLALRQLEEHGGNLNEAVNAHFSGGDGNMFSTPPGSAANPQHNFTHIDGQNQVEPHATPEYNFPHMSAQNQVAPQPQGLVPLLSAARTFKPSLLFDPSYSRDLFNRIGSAFTGRAPLSPHQGTVAAVPVDFNRGYDQPHFSGPRPTIQDTTGNTHGNDVEEEMIRAAIDASKREAEVPPVNELPEKQIHQDDGDIDRAVSLSLKTAEQERAIREQQEKDKNQESEIYIEELGSISSKELDEAILLETALFGESSYAPTLPSGPSRNVSPTTQAGRGPSSSADSALKTRQLLREQQDDEYLASLLADKEKEMNSLNEPGACHLKEVESDNKKIHPLEFERMLAAKSASLPCEPASDDENAVTLLVRMPDGSRLSRRFHKSDNLQLLFDFIDVGRVVKPGTYRVVSSYPRRAFTVDEGVLRLSELGLTNKQEALFLELI